MWITNPIALYGWILVIIWLFSSKPPRMAVIIAVLGSLLFLPMSTIELPIPQLFTLNKNTSVAYGILLGELFSGAKAKHPLKMDAYDIPMLLYCLVSPLMTSLSNGLGLYDGVGRMMHNFLSFGVFFWTGRRYFGAPSSIRTLNLALMIGGLISVPMILYEVRMSPQLHTNVYGFFQHSFIQSARSGGFRPILFMQHGLMVATWMMGITLLAFWLWQTKEVEKVWKIPSALVFVVLFVSTLLCKSSGALVYLSLGIVTLFIYKIKRSSKLLRWFLLFIPIYFFVRLANIITTVQIEALLVKLFVPERVASMTFRLVQEDLFGAKTLLRPFLGWGWIGRAWPRDAETGIQLINMVDSFWIVLFSTSGFLGLLSCYFCYGIGPLRVLASSGRPRNLSETKPAQYATDAIVLSIVIAFFLLDSLQNAMITPIYILSSGALVSYYTKAGDKEVFSES